MTELQALTPEQLRSLTQELKQALTDLYGERLDKVILYGSYARSDFHDESDVDVLAVLRVDSVRPSGEFRKYGDIVWAMWEKYGVWVSIRLTSVAKFTSSDLMLYQNIRAQGKTI
ncbi:nucleotidyltransferase domain-containing protein [Nibrella viscosa]|uniref:Nucleotidyltransferase domain-containing protein n=1 Tax=Nibrella viscosa TaxID=1084524 RepID=A0ABP8K764_9BACT